MARQIDSPKSQILIKFLLKKQCISQHTMMASNSASSASISSASNGLNLNKRWQSEDSESDHAFNPCVPMIEKKPPAPPSTVIKPPQASTTSASSDSESESSGDSSSDEEKKSKKNENDNLDTFSLGNFLNKVKNQSPAPSTQIPSESGASPEDDISDLLSQKRSPFPDNLNLITGVAGANPIPELSKPLSPLKGSPPPVTRSKKKRRTHKKSSTSALGKQILFTY